MWINTSWIFFYVICILIIVEFFIVLKNSAQLPKVYFYQ